MLILDEPTSGVDPVARDEFWELLISLSRDEGVTIFLSTHFMNEAERCDRISLMHAGKVLAAGTPTELIEAAARPRLEDAFIGFLEDAAGVAHKGEGPAEPAAAPEAKVFAPPKASEGGFDLSALGLCAAGDDGDHARSDSAHIRDHRPDHPDGHGRLRHLVRCRAPALRRLRPGPTLESRQFLDSFDNPKYFDRKPNLASADQIVSGLRSGELKFTVESRPTSVTI